MEVFKSMNKFFILSQGQSWQFQNEENILKTNIHRIKLL